jgi:hypothetical protein
MPIKLRKYYEHTVWLDNDETGQAEQVTLHIARLNVEQFAEFDAGSRRLNDPPSLRLLPGRKPDEQEKDERGRYVIADSVIYERRRDELDPAALAAYRTADEDDEHFSKVFMQAAIEQYISAPEGQIVDDEDRPVTTGAQLVRFFCARGDVLRTLVVAIYAANSMSADLKKVLRSQSAFAASLSEPSKEAPGTRPATAAASATTAASADSAAATASSGASTDTASPEADRPSSTPPANPTASPASSGQLVGSH